MSGKEPRAPAPAVERCPRATRPTQEALARPHLYDDERILWIERQRVPRITVVRLLASIPGALLGWFAAGMFAKARASASEPGVELLPAMLVIAAAAWLWATLHPPIKAYRGVREVYAVLTDHRLLWIEALADGTSRVRHPFRSAILGPGDLRSIAVRELGRGAGKILVIGTPDVDPHRARLSVRGEGRTVDEVAALLRRHLAVHEAAPRQLVPGDVRARHS